MELNRRDHEAIDQQQLNAPVEKISAEMAYILEHEMVFQQVLLGIIPQVEGMDNNEMRSAAIAIRVMD